MAGLSTNAPGLWGGFAGLLYGSTSLSTPPGFLADAPPAWVPAGGVLAFEFDNGLGYNSRNLVTTTPDSILTYTNPSPKLVYGDDGVLRYAAHNLLTYSEQFDNAIWVKTSATVTPNAAVAPDGNTTADTITWSAGTAAKNVVTNQTLGAVAHTCTVYMKHVSAQFIQLRFGFGFGAQAANFDLVNGTAQASGTPPTSFSITNVGNGWYRCSITATVTAAASNVGIGRIDSLSGASGGSMSAVGDVHVWGAQLNLGSSPLTYIPTTSAARYSLPIDHNPTTFEPLGVLIEEQRTNLLQWSEQFNDAAWAKAQATVTANSAIAPDGTTTADTLLDTAVSNIHYISQTVTGSPSGVTYTVSAYLKASTLSYATIGLSDISSGSLYAVAVFNLSSGAVATSGAAGAGYSVTSSSITSVGNGWYRCVATVVAGTSVAFLKTVVGCNKTGVITGSAGGFESYLGNGSGIYLWGAQLEAGAFPTSYVPTVASQSTRAADQVSILTSAFGWLQTRGTVVFEAMTPVGMGNAAYLLGLVDYVSSTNYFGVLRSSGGWIWRTGTGTATIRNFDVNTGYAEGAFSKYAASYEDDVGQGMSMNGASVVEELSDPVTRAVTTFTLGRTSSIGAMHYKRLTYFPTRRSNADLQVLST